MDENEALQNAKKHFDKYKYPPQDPFVAKNIDYISVEEPPIFGRQILLCYDNSDIWLEFTNYEFLVNSKESNRLVKIFLGKNNQKEKDSNTINKKVIEILDPNSVYFFQDAIIHHHDKLLANKNSNINIEDAINAGYDALIYHFGKNITKKEKNSVEPSLENLLQLIESS